MTVISAKTERSTEPEPSEEPEPVEVPGVTRPMTYEEYVATPEEMARYDILNGFKVYRLYGAEGNGMANPTRTHQRIQGRLFRAFLTYEEAARTGQVIQAPCDVLIARTPRLRTRQPDLLFLSNERLSENPPSDDPAPLDPAPELVVEIVSPSDRPSVLAAKIADYRAVEVQEVWVIRSEARTIEVVRLTTEEIETVASYAPGETVTSIAFPELTVAVADIFAE